MQKFRVFTDVDLMPQPMARSAYSDRSALMMAEMAALAYIPFENPAEEEVLDDLVEKIRSGKNIKTAKEELESFLVEYQSGGQEQALGELREQLSKAQFDLVGTYNMLETQGFMACRPSEDSKGDEPGIIVLSFRGTEKKIEDWRTDLDAEMTFIDGVGHHPGFWKAFASVRSDMERDLKPLLEQGYELYITGHSLGGALALFAARYFDGDRVAACYTFGSPRVADYSFAHMMKTPIYRVVNAHDIVPRTPPHILPHILVFLFNFLKWNWLAKKVGRYIGYVHHGDMRYLSRGKQENLGRYDDVMLLSNPSMFDRSRWWLSSIVSDFKGPVKDHSIQLYCDKLRSYARRRNR